jgi:uncharacterized metal-binding protein
MRINCAKCVSAHKRCRVREGKGAAACPASQEREQIERITEKYELPQNKEFARLASIQEAECYANRDRKPFVMHPTKSRLEEIMEFCRKMGYRRLGLAFCGGVAPEASLFVDVLEQNGFDVVGVSCKVGAIPKERLGLKEEEKTLIGEFDPMCNPIAQAEILNASNTDFNILLCLCVGHDSLFFRYIKGLTTVFAVKDRVTAHNPMAALYTSGTYYRRLRQGGVTKGQEVPLPLTKKERKRAKSG